MARQRHPKTVQRRAKKRGRSSPNQPKPDIGPVDTTAQDRAEPASPQTTALARLDPITRKIGEAKTALARATTVEEVKRIVDAADLLRTWAKKAQVGLQKQNEAAEVKLRAEDEGGNLTSAPQQERRRPSTKNCLHDGDSFGISPGARGGPGL